MASAPRRPVSRSSDCVRPSSVTFSTGRAPAGTTTASVPFVSATAPPRTARVCEPYATAIATSPVPPDRAAPAAGPVISARTSCCPSGTVVPVARRSPDATPAGSAPVTDATAASENEKCGPVSCAADRSSGVRPGAASTTPGSGPSRAYAGDRAGGVGEGVGAADGAGSPSEPLHATRANRARTTQIRRSTPEPYPAARRSSASTIV